MAKPMPRVSLFLIIFLALLPLSSAFLRASRVARNVSDKSDGLHPLEATDLVRASSMQTDRATDSQNETDTSGLKEAVVVTMHELTPGVRSLLSNLWAALAGGRTGLWVLVDKKRATPSMLKAIGSYIRNKEHVVTISYQTLMHKVFPKPTWSQQRSFDTFEGIYNSPAKPGAVWFVAEGPGTWYDQIWVLESDVRLHQGNWAQFFDYYRWRRTDLVSVIDNPPRWPHWRQCRHPGCKKVHGRQRSFLPIFRLSKRLAKDTLASLRAGYTGHHEAFLHTVCKEERRWHCVAEDLEQSPFYGCITWRKPLPRKLTPNKLYHPIKSA